MKKSVFILLFSVLFLCSCQENLTDISDQHFQKNDGVISSQQILYQDVLSENIDSLAIVNMNAVNEHIMMQKEEYLLVLGVNYDEDEKLPFVALESQGVYYGYVSHGVIYREKYDNPITGKPICFIFQNKLYVSEAGYMTPVGFKRYSLNPLIEDLTYYGFSGTNQLCKIPYVYNGKKYIIGTLSFSNTLSVEVYNLDDRQKNIYTMESPVMDLSMLFWDLWFVKDNFLYMVVYSHMQAYTKLLKIKLGTFDSCTLLASFEESSDTYEHIAKVNGNNYIFSTFSKKAFIVDSNDNVQFKDFPYNQSFIVGYGNKFYKSRENFSDRLYTEFTYQ